MATLSEYAHTLRSKNAGAFVLTVDIMLKTKAAYERVIQSYKMSPENIGALYKIDPKHVMVIGYPQVNAIKVSMPRLFGSGDIQDSDVYGAQQHVPLMQLELDDLDGRITADADKRETLESPDGKKAVPIVEVL